MNEGVIGEHYAVSSTLWAPYSEHHAVGTIQ